MESLFVKPYAQDQSKKYQKEARSWYPILSIFANVHYLALASQIIHIKYNGTKYQISDECFPIHFL